MSKRKSHIVYLDDLVSSVMLAKPLKAKCGYEKTYTREEINEENMYDLCKHCVAVVARESGDGSVLFQTHQDWTAVLESLWRFDYVTSKKPAGFTTSWNNGNTFTYNWSKNW